MQRSLEQYVLLVVLAATLTGATQQAVVTAQEKAVREAHRSWFEGLLNEDSSRLDNLLADDVTFGFGMTSMPRASFLGHLTSGELYYHEADHVEVHYRIYGNTGVVTGRSNLKYRWKGTEGFEGLQYIAVYVLNGSRWKMVAWQSAIEEE